MASVTLASISKSFGATPVLDAISLDVADGEFLTLVGPSGCGKSTLIRIIAGLEPQSAGAVSIGGAPVDHLRPHERKVAMVFQSYALYPHMSVFENMALPLTMARLNLLERLPLVRLASPRRRRVMDGIASEVRSVAEQLRIESYLDRRPAQLSGGQRQRVALGRAMVRHPHAFLMDEPLSNLDAKLRVQTRTEIAALQRRLGTTTVYVTHDQVEAMTMGDRVAVLRNGKLQQFASPADLYDKPANAFVAGFIGSPAMNLVTGQIVSSGVKIGEDSTLALERDQLALLHDAGLTEVTVGIRPEHFEVSDGGGIDVVIDLVEDLGSETYLYTHASPNVHLVARSFTRTPARLAETVELRRKPEGVVHLFNPDTGERIS